MEIVIKSDNEESIKAIIALAKKLNVEIEEEVGGLSMEEKAIMKNRILNFKAESALSFGDIDKWQREEREDRKLL